MIDPGGAGAAELVRGLRSRLGLTQEELARRLQVSFVTVNRWESGRSKPSGVAGRRLAALAAEAPARASMPRAHTTWFVGRESELRALDTPSRLVALTGPSGVGKSRLALEYAARRGGVTSLGIMAAASYTGSAELVVLEGDASSATVAAVTHLLAATGARVVVAAACPLGVSGEVVLPVLPLAPAAAAALLTSRLPARVLQQQQAIAELAAVTGGVPLALETLASWASALTLEQVVQHSEALLDETMTIAATQSASGLPADARATLQRIARYAAPFSIADAEAVTNLTDLTLVRSLRTLVEAGWLSADTVVGAYHLAAPWRRVLLAGLTSHEQAEVADRHGRHTLAAAIAEHSPPSAADLDLALHWAAATGNDESGLRAAASLWPWWLSSGRITEGRSWLDLLASRVGAGQEPVLARAWVASAVLAAESGDHAIAVSLATKASRACFAVGDTEQQAIAESALGSAHRYLGRRSEARSHFELALALREALGDRRGMATSLNNLALLAIDDGDLARARQMLARSLAEKRRLGEPRSVAIGLCNLAHTLLRLGLVREALAALQEADEIARTLGDDQLTGTVAANLGDVHVAEAAFAEALQDFERAVASYQGHPHDEVVALCGLARALAGLDRREEALAVLRTAEETADRTGNEHRMNEVRTTLAQLRSEPLSSPPDRLTPRQAEILGCVAEGDSNREIAVRLNLSAGTVERHLATTYRKLGLRNRVEAARYALQRGLVPPAP